MPYCYVEDTSIVAIVACECGSRASSRGGCVVLFETVRCIFWGIFFGELCSCCYLFFSLILLFGLFLFGATPNRWAIPVRKALLIIPADVGECVNVREIKEERERGRLQTALVHFSPSSSRRV